VRFWPNPIWGLDEDGTQNSEAFFLADAQGLLVGEKVGFEIEQLRVYCLPHFEETLPKQVRNSSGPDSSKDGESVHERTVRLKQQALDEYGGQCVDCGETELSLLVLCLKDEVIDSSGNPVWKELGVTSWAHKWVRLQELEYPKICLVRCLVCRSAHSNQRGAAPAGSQYARPEAEARKTKTDEAAKLRAEAVAAYGGACECGQSQIRNLWLVRKPGAEPLRWGGSGRKLSSRQRDKRLKKEGWPQTHYVTCQPCWKKSRQGQGGGYWE
jgi:hypothetical protein